MAKRGRPQRPYETTWGELVPGLYHCPDGRWRIASSGEKFSEPDERRAVARFQRQQQPAHVGVPVDTCITPYAHTPQGLKPSAGSLVDGPLIIRSSVTPDNFWPWLREQLISNPAHVARMTGIPELANLARLPLPRPPITIENLLASYERDNPSTPRTKRRVAATVRRLAQFTNATTVDDLTQDRLLAWRRSIENDPHLTSAATRTGMYSQVKTILSFGLKVGLDPQQLRGALDRCSVLWTSEPLPPVKPQPISREDFHALLVAADDTWRAWLLLALNLCMTAEDLCELRWEHFDLEAGTYAAVRVKTRRDRIPRAGVLWPETLDALKALPKKSAYVFTSRHGTRFNKNARVNQFAKLRAKAGLADTVKMNQIRDAAYTVASRASPDERWARVLAGHRAPGLQDNYVLRNPEAVKPACEAVYNVFGPFDIATG